MSIGWNYSDLSKLAKMYGGPEHLINKIKAGSFQKGFAKGRKASRPLLILLTLITLGVLGYEEGPKIYRAVKSKANKNNIEEEAELAEEILKKEIRKADGAEDNDIQS